LFVIHVIVAPDAVIPVAVIPEIVSPTTSESVVAFEELFIVAVTVTV
jgi:hypothetical protein